MALRELARNARNIEVTNAIVGHAHGEKKTRQGYHCLPINRLSMQLRLDEKRKNQNIIA